MEKMMAVSDFFYEIKNAILSFNGISDILDILFVALFIHDNPNVDLIDFKNINFTGR